MSLGSLVAEALEFYGVKSRARAEELVARARGGPDRRPRGGARRRRDARGARRMAQPVAVVDTPVVVAGLLADDPGAPLARLFDAMLGGLFVVLLSPRLLAEYREVLLRRRVRRVHGLAEDQVDDLLADLAQLARVVDPAPVSSPLVDERDAHLYHLLLTHRDAVLITADEGLGSKVGRRAMTPTKFSW